MSERYRVPVENLVEPALVRRLAWSPPQPATVDGVSAALRDGNARPWQVTLAAPLLAEAFVPVSESEAE